MTEQDQVESCTSLTPLLSYAYALSTAHIPARALLLPTGEHITQHSGILLVNQPIYQRAQLLNQEPEAALFLFSEQVQQQLTRNGFCLCVVIKRGESSVEHFCLHECTLLPQD